MVTGGTGTQTGTYAYVIPKPKKESCPPVLSRCFPMLQIAVATWVFGVEVAELWEVVWVR